MRFLFAGSLLLSSALAGVVPREEKVDYAGYKVLRVSLAKASKGLEEQVEKLAAHVLNPGKKTHLDVVVAPGSVAAVKALSPETVVVTEDIGALLAEEGELVPAKKADFSISAGMLLFTLYTLIGRLMNRSPQRNLVHCVPCIC